MSRLFVERLNGWRMSILDVKLIFQMPTQNAAYWKREALFYQRGTSYLVLVLSNSLLSLSNSSLSLASFDGS